MRPSREDSGPDDGRADPERGSAQHPAGAHAPDPTTMARGAAPRAPRPGAAALGTRRSQPSVRPARPDGRWAGGGRPALLHTTPAPLNEAAQAEGGALGGAQSGAPVLGPGAGTGGGGAREAAPPSGWESSGGGAPAGARRRPGARERTGEGTCPRRRAAFTRTARTRAAHAHARSTRSRPKRGQEPPHPHRQEAEPPEPSTTQGPEAPALPHHSGGGRSAPLPSDPPPAPVFSARVPAGRGLAGRPRGERPEPHENAKISTRKTAGRWNYLGRKHTGG